MASVAARLSDANQAQIHLVSLRSVRLGQPDVPTTGAASEGALLKTLADHESLFR